MSSAKDDSGTVYFVGKTPGYVWAAVEAPALSTYPLSKGLSGFARELILKKWKQPLLGHSRWHNGLKEIHLVTPYATGRAGVLLYRDGEVEIVADWEATPDGVQFWRDRIAQIFPKADLVDDLSFLRVTTDIREAFGTRMNLLITEKTGEIRVWSSDDWIRKNDQ